MPRLSPFLLLCCCLSGGFAAVPDDERWIQAELDSLVLDGDDWTAQCSFTLVAGDSTLGSPTLVSEIAGGGQPLAVAAGAPVAQTVTLTFSIDEAANLGSLAGDHLRLRCEILETLADTSTITHILPLILLVDLGGAG